jgi:hypothetical protein
MFAKIKNRTITASGAGVLMILLLTYVIGNAAFFNVYLAFRLLALTGVYIILALLAPDFRGIGDMFQEIWDTTRKDIPKEEKMDIIKSFLETTCAQWYKYWIMYQEIVNGGVERPKERIKRLYNQLVRVGKGEINLFQISWIFAYISYTLIVSCNYFAIAVPFDVMISMGILIMILISSGSILGLSKFLREVFKLVSCLDERTIESRLRTLELYIKRGSKRYYYISLNGNGEEVK